MAYITKEYLENNIKNYDQYRKLDKEGQANGLATLDANGKLVSTQIPSGVGAATYQGNPVTSIVAGSNTAMSISNGALTIASTAAGNGNVPAYTSADAHKPLVVNSSGTGTEWGTYYRETITGNGLTKSDTATTRSIKLKSATYDTKNNMGLTVSGIGGIKVAMSGAKAFTYDWNNNTTVPSESDIPVTVYQPDRANGKYYPVEITKDSVGVVCIPSASYEEDTNDPFIVTIEDYTVDGVAKKGLSITCPSNVLFAELDCSMETNGINVLTPIKSTKVNGKQTISIKNSCPNAGFSPENSYYAYLRFTTKPKRDLNNQLLEKMHTYNVTIIIDYDDEEEDYFPGIAF